MARPRLELLARHAPLLFVEAVVAAVPAAIEYAAEGGLYNHNDRTSFARRAHVNCRRRAHCNRARLLDQVHRDSDVREEQHAMVRASAQTPGNSGVLRSRPTRRLVVDLCSRELSDQSRGRESAVPGKFNTCLI